MGDNGKQAWIGILEEERRGGRFKRGSYADF